MAKDKIKLLTVEDAFFIEGRGVLVLPMITDYSGPTSFPVILRRPNGEETSAQANLDIPRLKIPRDPHPFACTLAGLGKEDVPSGTEIWISCEPLANNSSDAELTDRALKSMPPNSKKIKVGCMLEVKHKLPDSQHADELLDSPESFKRLTDRSDEIDRSRIATIFLSEEQAQRILDDLWPGENLLGATCGQGFSIDTAEQVANINKILAPDISIFFGQDHNWMLQTWPE